MKTCGTIVGGSALLFAAVAMLFGILFLMLPTTATNTDPLSDEAFYNQACRDIIANLKYNRGAYCEPRYFVKRGNGSCEIRGEVWSTNQFGANLNEPFEAMYTIQDGQKKLWYLKHAGKVIVWNE